MGTLHHEGFTRLDGIALRIGLHHQFPRQPPVQCCPQQPLIVKTKRVHKDLGT